MNGFARACLSWEAHERNKVMAMTWGHLYPPLGNRFKGHIDFVVGGYSQVDCQPCSISFEGINDSPVLYDDVQNFLFNRFQTEDSAAHTFKGTIRLPAGFYRWTGIYRKCKNESSQFIKGSVKCFHKF